MPGKMESLECDVNICSLVEEVMNASIAGHYFRSSPNHSSSPTSVTSAEKNPLTVVCDIDFRLNWVFETQAGAWKRILMNLLGNSLKYTAAGLIKVTLRQKKSETLSLRQNNTMVCLSVEDTGKGISAGFLANHLYKPFRQENELQPGTGLGLSIVKQLVSSIDGNIEVESQDGSGTTVSVTASLNASASIVTPSFMTSMSSGPLSRLKGRRVGFLGLDLHPQFGEIQTGIRSRESKRKMALKSTLAAGVEAFGCHSVTINSMDAIDIDIFITAEEHYQQVNSQNITARTAPLIILCTNPSLDYRQMKHVGGPTVYLSQPFGPHRLARALEACQPFCSGEYAAERTRKRGPAASVSPTHTIPPAAIEALSSTVESPKQKSAPSKSINTPPAVIREGRPRTLLVEDNPINLRVCPSLNELYIH